MPSVQFSPPRTYREILRLIKKAKNGKDTGFDSRAQAAADKNANEAAKQGNGHGEQKK